MRTLIIWILISIAAFWCYKNVDFDGMLNNYLKDTSKNEKTIKAVIDTHKINYEAEQEIINNN